MLTKENGHYLTPEVDEKGPDAIRAGSVSEKILEHSHDGDEALKAFRGHEGDIIEIDEATNKRLLRRIDWNLMPIMCIVYGLNFLDKTTISYASIMGLKDDLGLQGDDYQCKFSRLSSRLSADPHSRAGIDVLLWLPGLGISNEPTAPISTDWEIQRCLCGALGSSFGMLRGREQLSWSGCY